MVSATTGSSSDTFLILFIMVIINIIILFSRWFIFQKAGKPGWSAIVPIYNTVVMLDIIRQPIWWILFFFFPVTNVVVAIMINLELGKAFGKSGVWSFFLLYLCPFIGYPMLAAGDSRYLYNQEVTINDISNNDSVDEIENKNMLISPVQMPGTSPKSSSNNPSPVVSVPTSSSPQVVTEKLPK